MRKTKFEDDFFLPIVGNGAIASGDTAEGRNIPVLILDCVSHKNIINLIQLHQDSMPGDVLCTWGINKKYAFLILQFERPVSVKFGIKFDLETQGSLADGIVQSCGVYIQTGKRGDSIVNNLDSAKLLVEVPPRTKIPSWDEKLTGAISKRLRKEGLSRKEARLASKQFLERMREIWGYRKWIAICHQCIFATLHFGWFRNPKLYLKNASGSGANQQPDRLRHRTGDAIFRSHTKDGQRTPTEMAIRHLKSRQVNNSCLNHLLYKKI